MFTVIASQARLSFPFCLLFLPFLSRNKAARGLTGFINGAATPPNLGVSRTVLLAGPITERKSTGRKQRTYRPTSLKGEFKRSPANSFTPSPSAPAKEASRHFIDGAATPPNPGGEFRVTFRVYERSHNEVPKLETSCGFSPRSMSPLLWAERSYDPEIHFVNACGP